MLKRYQMYGSHVGVIEEESEHGKWVDANDAQAEIDRLRQLLREACDGLDADCETYKRIHAVLDAE